MVPFQLVCVWAVVAADPVRSVARRARGPLARERLLLGVQVRPRAGALLALGVLLAVRARWGWSGVALGLGALVKWTPVLAAVVLVAHLLARRRLDAGTHVAALAATILVVRPPVGLGRRCQLPRTRAKATVRSPPSRSGTCRSTL